MCIICMPTVLYRLRMIFSDHVCCVLLFIHPFSVPQSHRESRAYPRGHRAQDRDNLKQGANPSLGKISHANNYILRTTLMTAMQSAYSACLCTQGENQSTRREPPKPMENMETSSRSIDTPGIRSVKVQHQTIKNVLQKEHQTLKSEVV